MHSEGYFTVKGETTEGHITSTTFVNAPVDMPIISVAEICDGDSDVNFTKQGGTIVDGSTGKTSRFVKRLGVYFIKLRVSRKTSPMSVRNDEDANTGFARQGAN